MTIVHNQGSQVDDDNDPIPENIPVSGTSSTSDLKEGQPWGWTGIDRRRIVQPEKVGPAYSNEMDSSWCCIISCMATVPPIAFFTDHPCQHIWSHHCYWRSRNCLGRTSLLLWDVRHHVYSHWLHPWWLLDCWSQLWSTIEPLSILLQFLHEQASFWHHPFRTMPNWLPTTLL